MGVGGRGQGKCKNSNRYPPPLFLFLTIDRPHGTNFISFLSLSLPLKSKRVAISLVKTGYVLAKITPAL